MQTTQPQLSASQRESRSVIINWVRATEEFHGQYVRINEVINSLEANQRFTLTGSTTNTRRNVQALLQLRQYMSDVLATLLTDINKSKPGQLTSHARLLQDISRQVEAELKRLALPQA